MSPPSGLKIELVCFSETIASLDESILSQNIEEYHGRSLSCLRNQV